MQCHAHLYPVDRRILAVVEVQDGHLTACGETGTHSMLVPGQEEGGRVHCRLHQRG